MSADALHLVIYRQAQSLNSSHDGIAANGSDDTVAAPVFAWWKIASGRVVQSGAAHDVLVAAGFGRDTMPDLVTLLLSNDDAAVRLHDFNNITGPQAVAATRIAALDSAIDGADMLHGAAALRPQGSAFNGDDPHNDLQGGGQTADGQLRTISAVARKDMLHERLTELRQMGLEPDHIYPAAAIFSPLSAGYTRFALGQDHYLIGTDLAAMDDAALRQALLINDEPPLLGDADVNAALAALPSGSLPNLRHGVFAPQRTGGLFTVPQKKWLAGLVAALLVVTLAIPAMRLWRYSSAEDAAVSTVLTKVQNVFPAATDMTTARTLIDSELAKRGAGASLFSIPAAALISALEQAPGLTLQNLRYQQGGVVSAAVAAPDGETMNRFLEALQNDQGYTVTCQQCDTPSARVFDITVRG